MNREEAKYYLQSSGFSEEQIDTIEKAFTSTDAINRQAVLDIVDSYSESRSNVEDVTQDMISDILALPSVTPQPKTGHWIETDKYESYRFKCSECYRGTDDITDYCPNCGCRMVEPQESEG